MRGASVMSWFWRPWAVFRGMFSFRTKKRARPTRTGLCRSARAKRFPSPISWAPWQRPRLQNQEVYTIELLPNLAKQARARLERLGYHNIEVRSGDGYRGWPEAAPFDAIVVTCGADHVPGPLFEQLKPGGAMVIPVGGQSEIQILRVITKGLHGEQQSRDLAPVRFVPLRRAGD